MKGRKKFKGQRQDGRSFRGTFVRRMTRLELSEWRNEDLYGTLNVPSDAEDAAIKKAFRHLSRKYHPDKQHSDEQRQHAKGAFERIRDAYDVLGDHDKRILYDMGGLSFVNNAKETPKGSDFTLEHTFTLEEAYTGTQRRVGVRRRIVCHHGDTQKCKRCPNEIKTVLRQMGMMRVQQRVEVPSDRHCRLHTKRLPVHIEPGVQDGTLLRFPLESEQRPGMVPGDVIVRLKQQTHPRFTRDGHTLHTHMHITLKEALLGVERTLRHLDGHAVTVRQLARPTRVNEIHIIPQEGMPLEDGGAGDLHVHIDIDMPSSLTAEQREWIRLHL